MQGRGRGKLMTLPSWMSGGATDNGTDGDSDHQVINGNQQYFTPSGFTVPAPTALVSAATGNFIPPVLSSGFNPTTASAISFPVASPALVSDPNNEKSNWSIHVAQDGRKYWYNRVTELSTYDKPFCLKTPEERAIPPCKWKEYSADGRKYFSDGISSVWEEPEEYRVWREKIEAIENKSTKVVSNEREDLKRKSSNTNLASTYANAADALQAFNNLLSEKKISSTAKSKEIRDLCQDDPRWNALKSAGERNQTISEYQTKKLKQEREVKQQKAKKLRDAFLIMLAENTRIDAKTRWSQAIEILKDDSRFQSVEDAHEREDLFSEFVSELAKKEREDKIKSREVGLSFINQTIDDLHKSGKLTRSSNWNDERDYFMSLLKVPETRAYEEYDIKKFVVDFVNKLELAYREDERKRREEATKLLSRKQDELLKFLEKLVDSGVIRDGIRSKELQELSEVVVSAPYKELTEVVSSLEIPSNVSASRPSSVTILNNIMHEVARKALDYLEDTYQIYRRLLRNIARDIRYKFLSTETSVTHFKNAVLKSSSLKEIYDPKSQTSTIVLDINQTEDGEEIDDSITDVAASFNLKISKESNLIRHFLTHQFNVFEVIYNELVKRAIDEQEEDARRQKKREEKFISLLQENFYRSDQLEIPWDEAKRRLEGYSAYEDLHRADRRRLFTDYINDLKKKMEQKSRNLKSMNEEKLNNGKPVQTTVAADDVNIEEGEISGDAINNTNSNEVGLPVDTQHVTSNEHEGDNGMKQEKEETLSESSYGSDSSSDDDSKDSKSHHKRKSKKDKHKKDKDRHHKHKKHRRDRSAEIDELERKRRRRSYS